jgi:hypothetical protein
MLRRSGRLETLAASTPALAEKGLSLGYNNAQPQNTARGL